MSEYVDEQLIAEANNSVRDVLKDGVKFAVQRRQNETDIEEADLRQAAQDATHEILGPLVDTVYEAYEKGLGQPDSAAISKVFDDLAVRAKLYELGNSDAHVRLSTPSREVVGRYHGIQMYEGEECVHTSGDTFTPVSAVRKVEVLDE